MREKLQNALGTFKACLFNDEPPQTEFQSAYTKGAIDAFNVALILLDDPAYDVSTYRSEFMPDVKKVETATPYSYGGL